MSAIGITKPYKETIFCTNCVQDSEVTNLVWEIKNIGILLDEWPFSIKAPVLHFDAGESIGLPSQWAFYISPPFKNAPLCVGLTLLKSPKNIKEVCAEPSFEITKGTGDLVKSSPLVQPHNFKDEIAVLRAHKYDLLFNKTSPKYAMVVDGSLKIHLTLKLFSPKDFITEEIGTQMYMKFEEEEEGRKALAGDLGKLLESRENADVTFQFKSGETLKAHKTILGARSPVLGAMFQTKMKESSTGVVPLDDITFEGMKILLKFIYCGKMDEKWKEDDLIEDLLNASEKYSVPALKQFFNETLHTICTNENALDVLDIARLYKLELAVKNTFYFIKKNAENIL